jgi:hypothetical protein
MLNLVVGKERLIFTGPCIVIYSYSTTNKINLLSKIMYSCKTLYMFRTVFPSIIRSSKLRIQQRYVKQLPLHAAIGDEMRNFELLMMDGKTIRNMCYKHK